MSAFNPFKTVDQLAIGDVIHTEQGTATIVQIDSCPAFTQLGLHFPTHHESVAPCQFRYAPDFIFCTAEQ